MSVALVPRHELEFVALSTPVAIPPRIIAIATISDGVMASSKKTAEHMTPTTGVANKIREVVTAGKLRFATAMAQ
jgi:hypothetical protein